MKLFKRKNFQALIYAIFISLPMLSILPSTIYFAFNHEAANYTLEEVIETYEYETNEVNSVDDLIVGNIYKFELENYDISNISTSYLYVSKFYNITTDYQLNSTFLAFRGIAITSYYNDKALTFGDYYNENGDNYIAYRNTYGLPNITISCYFVYQNLTSSNDLVQFISASDYLGEKNVEVIESEMNPMSAFDNAIGKFVSDNDFGRLDFFTFFSSLFLTSSSMNNLYIHFINWYMNYALYVSLAYLLFGVLLYFVNFFRKLVENSEDTHIGGF